MTGLVADQPDSVSAHLRQCAGCGMFQVTPTLSRGMTAQCVRCPTILIKGPAHSLQHSIALNVAALVLLLILCLTMLMGVETAGIALQAGLFSGPEELVRRGMPSLAIVVVFVVLVAPMLKLAGTVYVLIRLHEANPPRHLRRVFTLAERLRPWSMIEVFVFGVFVAYVKLGDLVRITLLPGVYVLLALTFVVIWADADLDREAVWERLGGPDLDTLPPAGATPRPPGPNAIGCETCGLVSEPRHGHGKCPRCDSQLHRRKPNSISRTWALVIAAAVLYIPANYYPVLTVMQLGAGMPSTIMGGVEELIASKMYPLAALVFFASVAVPMMKLLGLSFMLIAAQTGSAAGLRQRVRLYQAVCFVGRWSMIDIFMEALLGALVRFGTVITIEPGIGAVAFCGVVILTMFAAETFDPRLMWDAAERAQPREVAELDAAGAG